MFQFFIESVVIITIIINVQCNFFKKEAKIEADIVYMRTCKVNEDKPAMFNLTFSKFNRTHYAFAINVSLYEPFDETYYLDVDVQKWGDGGWKKNFFHFYNRDACNNLLLYLGPFWRNILIAAGVVPPKCPIQPGVYSFKNMMFEWVKIPLVIQPGKFYFKFVTIKNRMIRSCIEGEIVPNEVYYWED